MSATASKASRREIRRALGPTALELLDAHSESLTLHASRLTFLKTECATLTSELAKLREVQHLFGDQLFVSVPLDVAVATAVLRRGFWGRLTWLASGR